METQTFTDKHLKAFDDLIEKYESLTVEDLRLTSERNLYISAKDALNLITGFGIRKTCTLCQSIEKFNSHIVKEIKCHLCVYNLYKQSFPVEERESIVLPCLYTPYYEEINHSQSFGGIIQYIKLRSVFMKQLREQIKQSCH